jgi:hypothetical protein
VTTEEKRVALYKALKEMCWTLPASVEGIAAVLEYEEPKLEAYLEGLVHMRELEKATVQVQLPEAEDDGFGGKGFGFDDDTPEDLSVGYRLTEFGQRWTDLMLAGGQPSER